LNFTTGTVTANGATARFNVVFCHETQGDVVCASLIVKERINPNSHIEVAADVVSGRERDNNIDVRAQDVADKSNTIRIGANKRRSFNREIFTAAPGAIKKNYKVVAGFSRPFRLRA
jgi:hypothetical protein